MSQSLSSPRGKPFQSKLEPVAQVIRELRRHRKSYREIASILRDQHGISADRTTIWSFVKVRSKPRNVITMIDDSHETPSVATHRSKGRSAIDALKAKPVSAVPKPLFVFDENKPLTLKKETL